MASFEERCEYSMAVAETTYCISEQALQVIYDRKASRGKKPLRTPNPKTSKYTLEETRGMIELISEKLSTQFSSTGVSPTDTSSDEEVDVISYEDNTLHSRINNSQQHFSRTPAYSKPGKVMRKNEATPQSPVKKKGIFTSKNWSTPMIPPASAFPLQYELFHPNTPSAASHGQIMTAPQTSTFQNGRLKSNLDLLVENDLQNSDPMRTNNSSIRNSQNEAEMIYSDISNGEEESDSEEESDFCLKYDSEPVQPKMDPAGYYAMYGSYYDSAQQQASKLASASQPTSVVFEERSSVADYLELPASSSKAFSPSMLPKPREEYRALSNRRLRL